MCSTGVFSAIEVSYENTLYKFTSEFDFGVICVTICVLSYWLCFFHAECHRMFARNHRPLVGYCLLTDERRGLEELLAPPKLPLSREQGDGHTCSAVTL